MSDSRIPKWAMSYAEKGWPVFPLVPRQKRPMTGRGFLDATTDPDQVAEWWGKAPDANIGIPVSEKFVVLDVDSQAALQALKFQDVEMPTTVHAMTPRGHHFWFLAPEGIPLKPQVDILGNGDVDVRAIGSYLVVPPSVVGTKNYRWEVPPKPENFTEAPDWLVEACRRDRIPTGLSGEAEEREGIDPDTVLAGVAEGSRDWTIFRYACRLRQQDRSRSEVELLIQHAARSAVPPFPSSEATRKVDQAFNYAVERKAEADNKGEIPWRHTSDAVDCPVTAIQWLCQPILRPVLTLLWAPAFAGKSTLALQLCHAIATGSNFLGTMRCQKAGVRFVGYEQGDREDRTRMWDHIGVRPGSHSDADFMEVGDLPRADEGGLDALDKSLSESPNVKLLVIDTLARFWGMGKQKTSANAFYQESEAMAKIEKLGKAHGICLFVTTHSTASKAKVSGTEAMRGIPRCLMHLDRPDPTKPEGTLAVTHNGAPGTTLNLWLEPDHGWSILGPSVDATAPDYESMTH